MGLDAMGKLVKHRRHLNLGPLQRTKTAFNDQKSLIAASGILQSDRIVIGLQYPFSIIVLRLVRIPDEVCHPYSGGSERFQRGITIDILFFALHPLQLGL